MARLKSLAINALAVVLPNSVKNSLLHLAFHLAKPEFDRFAHLYNFAPNMEMGLRTIASRGLRPDTIIDVGAFEGDWGRMARRIWPSSKIEMFEPNSEKDKIVSSTAQQLNARLHSNLLGAEDGKFVTFYVMESGSSIMAECSPLKRSSEKRLLTRLDTVLPEVAGRAFLKLDAQGYELEIIRGASKILQSIDAVLLEVAIIEINEGAPLLHDVTAFMKQLGFLAYEILEIHRRPLDLALNQVDILFLREDSPLLADKRHFA
jgi:FkbM family methyltransferase